MSKINLDHLEETTKVSLGYTPRRLQAYLHNACKRFNVIVCHRRFGKTRFSLGHLLDKALKNNQENPNYAYIAPTYGQAERVAWTYLKDHLRNMPTAKINEAKLRVEIHRPDKGDKITIWLLGAENPDSIRGIYLDGVILDEYAQCSPEIWGEVIRPALSDRKGWAVFIGTPKGMNAFYKMYQQAVRLQKDSPQLGWFAFVAKASKTGILDEIELDGAKQEMSDEEFQQEFECSFLAALVGSYYGKYITEIEKRNQITELPYDKRYLVDTVWDLGIGDSTSIWFLQEVGNKIHVIDYLEASGMGLEYYASELKKKDYAYNDHWIPHDGEHQELGTGVTRQETLKQLGFKTKIVPKQKIDDGINAVRVILTKCWFDSIKCQRGLDALKNYEKKWDSKNNLFMDKPLHNWASHGADAFRYLALTYGSGRRKLNMVDLQREADNKYNHFGG